MSASIEVLPEEPENGPDVTTITFRTSTGSNINWWFLKTHWIKSLYDYVISLGVEAGFESEHSNFEIMQNFPKISYKDMKQTLEEAGLHPRSKVIIHELEHE